MPSHQALPLSPGERDRLRARHLADQEAAGRRRSGHPPAGPRPHRGICGLASLLVLAFLVAGGYSVAAATGVAPAFPGSALAGSP